MFVISLFIKYRSFKNIILSLSHCTAWRNAQTLKRQKYFCQPFLAAILDCLLHISFSRLKKWIFIIILKVSHILQNKKKSISTKHSTLVAIYRIEKDICIEFLNEKLWWQRIATKRRNNVNHLFLTFLLLFWSFKINKNSQWI